MTTRAYSVLVIATLCWAANAVAGKMAVGHVSPMVLTFLRWVLAVAMILVIAREPLKRDLPKLIERLPFVLFFGAVGFTSFNVLLYSALRHTSTINVAIEQAGIPMLIFILNFIGWRTRVSAAQIFGFTITLVGVALTALHGDLGRLLSLDLNFGDALMLLAVVAYAVYTITLRWKPAVDWSSLMAGSSIAALITALPLLGWETMTGTAEWPDMQGWVIVAFTAIFPSLIAQVLYIKGVEGIGANRAGLFINLIPVFGTLMSIVVLGEQAQLFHGVALLLTLGGIAIAEWGRPKT